MTKNIRNLKMLRAALIALIAIMIALTLLNMILMVGAILLRDYTGLISLIATLYCVYQLERQIYLLRIVTEDIRKLKDNTN